MENSSDQLDGLKGALGNLQKHFGDIEKLTAQTQDLLPKDMFKAEIDGHTLEISIGMSGAAIVFNFADKSKCASLFNELKQQKKGFFQRVFNIK